jgi:signal transduction histidine kinase
MSHELRTPLNAIIGLTEMMVTNAARFGTEKATSFSPQFNQAALPRGRLNRLHPEGRGVRSYTRNSWT